MAAISHAPAMQLPITPQQRHLPSLLPRLCQYGGCSRLSRRILWRKIRNSVAVPVLPAAHFGDNSANPAIELQFFLIPFSESKTECLPASRLCFSL
jgi:hypothetical protein